LSAIVKKKIYPRQLEWTEGHNLEDVTKCRHHLQQIGTVFSKLVDKQVVPET
jgi:hypothetical protein